MDSVEDPLPVPLEPHFAGKHAFLAASLHQLTNQHPPAFIGVWVPVGWPVHIPKRSATKRDRRNVEVGVAKARPWAQAGRTGCSPPITPARINGTTWDLRRPEPDPATDAVATSSYVLVRLIPDPHDTNGTLELVFATVADVGFGTLDHVQHDRKRKRPPPIARSAARRQSEAAYWIGSLRSSRVAFVISICSCVVYWLFLVYLPTFAQQQLHLTASAALFSTATAGLIYLLFTPAVGALSDRIGRKPLLYASFLGTVVLGYPLFSLLVSWHSVQDLLLVQAIATICLTCNTGVACAMLAELFPTRIRYTALSIGYGLSVAIFGGFAALIATGLIRMTGDPLSPAYYVVAGGAASLIATFFMTEGAKKPLPA
jgi:hypothetical protein